MARTIYQLRRQRQLLRDEIMEHLDILMGSVTTKGPKRPGFNLTRTVDGITRTRHIRVENLERVRLMTRRYKQLKVLLVRLADVNWAILTLESE
jgi:hypothetical protein